MFGLGCVMALLDSRFPPQSDTPDLTYIHHNIHNANPTKSRCRETGPLKLASLSAEETELMGAMQARLDTLARHAASLGTFAFVI